MTFKSYGQTKLTRPSERVNLIVIDVSSMMYRKLGQTGLKISRFILGTMQMGWIVNGGLINGDQILVPGEPEHNTLAERSRDGIPIPPGTHQKLRAAAARFSLPLPEGL